MTEETPFHQYRNSFGFYHPPHKPLRGKSFVLSISDNFDVKVKILREQSGDDHDLLNLKADLIDIKTKKRIGYLLGSILLMEDLEDNDSFWDHCDSVSTTLEHFAAEFLKSGHSVYNLAKGGNVFYADKLEIKPQYCGKGLGIAALKRIINFIAKEHNVILCAMRPFPLQYAKKEQLSEEEMEELKNATNKLQAYYRKHFSLKPICKNSKHFFWCIG